MFATSTVVVVTAVAVLMEAGPVDCVEVGVEVLGLLGDGGAVLGLGLHVGQDQDLLLLLNLLHRTLSGEDDTAVVHLGTVTVHNMQSHLLNLLRVQVDVHLLSSCLWCL